ncbi:MAG: transketolase [Gammaproteobacteria bacterium]|nr:transketolase [Gammaproteobacteria bacterium]
MTQTADTGQARSAAARRELANAVRALSMDAVQAANSGHPGAPMGMADLVEVLWNDFLVHNPANPAWSNRDRFVLSNGHASVLLYAVLHLSGYDLSLDELRRFRQLHSKTAGHPEYGVTPGIETTTGPLGQGLANAVGMALAERVLAAKFNRPEFRIVDHHTYVTVGDGCLMEGISHEACALAGTLGLGKLIAIYDDNGISIDGDVRGWFTDDTPARFEAYGWHVVRQVDGHDAAAVAAALTEARAVTDRPSLVCCKTVIARGAPNKQGSASSHGAALGAAEVEATRANIGWAHPPFVIPEQVYRGWDARARGAAAESRWQDLFANYRQAFPELAAEFDRRMSGELPADWRECADAIVRDAIAGNKKAATRKSSQQAIERFAPLLPELIGGSADLTGSNNTDWSGSRPLRREALDGNYIYFGVREFAMTAIANGLALHGGFVPYTGTFLVFSDYARNAVRMAALMRQRQVLVYTHDSIGLGEDGPTHQPIEHAASLRLIPNLDVWRPADAAETLIAWRAAIERRDGPSALLLSRQDLPPVLTPAHAGLAERGGYVLHEATGTPTLLLIACGSEVALSLTVAEQLAAGGERVRVVSMPCCEVFERQAEDYREAVLPRAVRRRVVIDAGASAGWYRYTGLDGLVIGIDRFGESAPAAELFKIFNLTPDKVRQSISDFLTRN